MSQSVMDAVMLQGFAEGEAVPGAAEEASSTSQPLVFGESLSGRSSLTNGTSVPLPDNGHEENGDNEAQAAGQLLVTVMVVTEGTTS